MIVICRLLDQWDEDEEPLPEDELPEHLRKPPALDMSSLDMSNPEGLLQATKKGKTLMTFVTVANKPERERTETITKLWQTSLWNNHIQAERSFLFIFLRGSREDGCFFHLSPIHIQVYPMINSLLKRHSQCIKWTVMEN